MIATFITFLLAITFIVLMLLTLVYRNQEPKSSFAVFGGSFNPLHIGHKAIIKDLSEKYDWVYLIVTPKNPLKDTVSSDTVNERLNKAYNAVLKHEIFNVTVSDIEKDMLPPYYTIKTLDELKRKNPKGEFKLVIGADNLRQMREWKDYKRILLEYGVLVYPRGNDDANVLETLKYEFLKENSQYRIEISDTIIPNISSTEIRTAILQGSNVDNLLM